MHVLGEALIKKMRKSRSNTKSVLSLVDNPAAATGGFKKLEALRILQAKYSLINDFKGVISGKETEAFHIGVFLKLSRFAHSCNPNSVLKFVGDHAIVMALRDISDGEKLTISLVNPLLPIRERIATLKLRGIMCECSSCLDEVGCLPP